MVGARLLLSVTWIKPWDGHFPAELLKTRKGRGKNALGTPPIRNGYPLAICPVSSVAPRSAGSWAEEAAFGILRSTAAKRS